MVRGRRRMDNNDSSMKSRRPRNGVLLTQAAVQGIALGLTVLGCQTTTDRTSVNAPMESSSAASSASSSPLAAPTQAKNPIVPIVPRIVSADRGDRDCCNGKNACKGQSGCSSNAGDGSCGFGHDCKGKNECKGKGTACDFSDDAANMPQQPSVFGGQPLPNQPQPPPPPRRRLGRP
jgi:hypothetical protein